MVECMVLERLRSSTQKYINPKYNTMLIIINMSRFNIVLFIIALLKKQFDIYIVLLYLYINLIRE